MHRDIAPLPGYPEPYGMLLATLQDGTAEWRNELWHDCDADMMTRRVRPGGQSIGALILHMIIVELDWLESFVLGREIGEDVKQELMWDQIDVDAGIWPDPPHQPSSWYFDLQDRYRIRTLEIIKDFPAPDALIPGRQDTFTPRWILGHVIQHESYHGGQVVMIYDLCEKASLDSVRAAENE